jgi:hypothetical protein
MSENLTPLQMVTDLLQAIDRIEAAARVMRTVLTPIRLRGQIHLGDIRSAIGENQESVEELRTAVKRIVDFSIPEQSSQ